MCCETFEFLRVSSIGSHRPHPTLPQAAYAKNYDIAFCLLQPRFGATGLVRLPTGSTARFVGSMSTKQNVAELFLKIGAFLGRYEVELLPPAPPAFPRPAPPAAARPARPRYFKQQS